MHWILALSLLTSSDAVSSSPNPTCAQLLAQGQCGEADIACVLCLLQQKAIEVESLTKQLAISKEQYRNASELIDVWKAQAKVAHDAATEAMAALKPMAWYQSPVLWTAVGLTIGVVLAVGIVYALKPAFSTSR